MAANVNRYPTKAAPAKKAAPARKAAPAKKAAAKKAAPAKKVVDTRTAEEKHMDDLRLMVETLNKEAKKHGLCSEYNKVIKNVAGKLSVTLPDDVISPPGTYQFPDVAVRISGKWKGLKPGVNAYGDHYMKRDISAHFVAAFTEAINAFLASYVPVEGTIDAKVASATLHGTYLYEL